jgi:hypothetical protein
MQLTPKTGVVFVASAKLYEQCADGLRLVAYCMDTPNAIASALAQLPNVVLIKGWCSGLSVPSDYRGRPTDLDPRLIMAESAR